MSFDQLIDRTEQALVVTTTDVHIRWYTGWIPAIGLDAVRGVLQNRNVTGNIQTRVCIQTAGVRSDNPDTPVNLESGYLSGAGARCTGDLDVTSYTGTAMLVRFGVAYKLSGAGAPGMADVHLELCYLARGRLFGTREFRALAPDTGDQYEVLTPFIPALFMSKAKLAVVVSGVSGNFRCRAAYRTATTTIESPNGWSTTWDVWHTGSSEFNTGELTVSASSDMYAQLALQFQLSSGTNGFGQVKATTSVRRG